MTPPVTSLLPAVDAVSRPLRERSASPSLSDAFNSALTQGEVSLAALRAVAPADRRDRFLTLLTIYDLHGAALATLGPAVRWQGHPAVAELKYRLEADWLAELELGWVEAGSLADSADPARTLKAMRAIAAQERLPPAYRWLAKSAGRAEAVAFLALEGGPDGGFDDLVAVCQLGLSGSAKLELAKNYWDEMGQGRADGVHTVLHRRMAAALDLPAVPRDCQPVAALERAALGGLLATNRWLQPEMLGALGLLELQAGPRCRLVLKCFDRLGVPADAYPFYVEHADVDPVHGKDWLDKAIVPTVAEHPEWGPRIVKGAWWRSSVNSAFFRYLHDAMAGEASPT